MTFRHVMQAEPAPGDAGMTVIMLALPLLFVLGALSWVLATGLWPR